MLWRRIEVCIFELDFELNKFLGSPPLNSKVQVFVLVTNKHQPIFTNSHPYTARLTEAAIPGTSVLTVRAVSHTNGLIRYRIITGDPHRDFNIDFNKGTIVVKKKLNRELRSDYFLEVEAIDVLREQVSATTSVEIVLENVNDTPPVFDAPLYEFYVSESASIGTLLGRLKASDADRSNAKGESGAELAYSLDGGNQSDGRFLKNFKKIYLFFVVKIQLDPITGQLYLSSLLDFESIRFYEYTARVFDNGHLWDETVVQIHVIDSNDNPPNFIPPIRLQIFSRALSANRFLYQIDADDPDTISSFADSQSRFRFAILHGDESLFAIDTLTGVIRSLRRLDTHEENQLITQMLIRKSLNVSVTDGHFQITASVFSLNIQTFIRFFLGVCRGRDSAR